MNNNDACTRQDLYEPSKPLESGPGQMESV